MGKYDKVYEQYYRNIGGSDKIFRNKQTENLNDVKYTIRGSNRGHNNNRRKNDDNLLVILARIFLVSTVLSLALFSGIIICKYNFGQKGQYVYLYFKDVVSTDGYYKDYISSLKLDIVAKIKRDDDYFLDASMIEGKKNLEEKVEKAAKLDKENGDSAKVGSFNINDSIVEDDSSSNTLSEDSYKDILSTFKGLDIKAKSDEGIVLSLEDKKLLLAKDGVVKDTDEKKEGFMVVIKYSDNLEGYFYNLESLDCKQGDKLKKGDGIGNIKTKKDIVFKLKANGEFVSPKEYLDFI